MKKYIKITAIGIVISTIAFSLFEKVFANKNEIKINPAVEVLNKHNTVAQSGTFCPRTTLTELYDKTPSSEELYEHCKVCQIGVFLDHKDGKVSCSYCSINKNESISAR